MKVIYPNSQWFVKTFVQQTWIIECVYRILGLSQDCRETNQFDLLLFLYDLVLQI